MSDPIRRAQTGRGVVELVDERVAGGWRVERARGTVAALHAAELSAPALNDGSAAGATRTAAEPVPGRVVRFCEVLDAAVVLGSSQSASDLDETAVQRAGLRMVRRRSGGGAVLLQPDAQLWVDLFVPSGDPLWVADVERASWWVGEWWAGALGAGGRVHRAPLVDRDVGSLVCFASVGPGEVIDPEGRKVVGISQRRTRLGARFQTVAHLRWDPDLLLGLFADRPTAARLDPLVRGSVGVVGGADRLVGRLLDRLPDRLPDGVPP